MARVSQLEEIDDINYDKGSKKWSYWELDIKEDNSGEILAFTKSGSV